MLMIQNCSFGKLSALPLAVSVLFLFVSFSANASYNAGQFNNTKWSTPKECFRPCRERQQPLYCYYKFTLERLMTMGPICDWCTSNNTDRLTGTSTCKCIEADGVEKAVTVVNGMLPGPSIQVCLHDRIIVDVLNMLDGVSITMHWHGVTLKGYPYFDGVPRVTQCPILSHNTFRYYFAANNPGTHYYHSHSSVHVIDGLYGSLIVRTSPNVDPHSSLYDEDSPDHVIFVSDWGHDLAHENYPRYLPKMQNILINGKGVYKNTSTYKVKDTKPELFTVTSGKRYRFRFINAFSTTCSLKFFIKQHPLLIIALDGADIEPIEVNSFLVSSGERLDFIVRADQPIGTYRMFVITTGVCEYRLQQIALLHYTNSMNTSSSSSEVDDSDLQENVQISSYTTEGFEQNDNQSRSLDHLKINCYAAQAKEIESESTNCHDQLRAMKQPNKTLYRVEPDYQYILSVSFTEYKTEQTAFAPLSYLRFLSTETAVLVGTIGNLSLLYPEVPPISQGLADEQICNVTHFPADCGTPCACRHVYHVRKDSLVEIFAYDPLPYSITAHPVHMHGYSFSVFAQGIFATKPDNSRESVQDVILKHKERLRDGVYDRPPIKDTMLIPSRGYVIIRFIADKPGWWLFHCHFAWHEIVGMALIFHIGEDSDLPPIPPNFPKCTSWMPEANFH